MTPISIIIPTYNRSHLIKRTIDSVIRQTSSDWELIIVDDGSKDDTESVVKQYLSNNVRYIYQDNGGANKARNIGAKNARYTYLAFLDSDDELFPDWLESFQVALEKRPEIVCCGTHRFEPGKNIEVIPKSLGKIFDFAIGKFTNGACYVIDKNLFFERGGFDEELPSGQHTELSFRLANDIISKKIRVENIFRPLVKIYVHDGPRIRTSSESKFKGALRILRKHSKLLAREPMVKRDYAKIVSFHALDRRFFGLAMRAFFTFCKYSILAKFR